MLIGLLGYAGAGKDTVAGLLPGFERRAFADKLRALAYASNPCIGSTWADLRNQVDHYGWDRLKRLSPEVRQYLQTLGMGVREVLGEDTWIDACLPEEMRDFVKPYPLDVVITDCRFENEAQRILSLGGVLWVVERPGVGPVNSHESEGYARWINGYHWTRIANTGTIEDLRSAVLKALGA